MWDWIMEKNKNMLRTVWASKWYFYKNTEPQKKIRRSYKKRSVVVKAFWFRRERNGIGKNRRSHQIHHVGNGAAKITTTTTTAATTMR